MIASAALFFALLLASCGGGGNDGPTPTPAGAANGLLTVRTFEWGFEPANLLLRQGEEVRIELVNEGRALHNLKIDDLDADGIESESTGSLSADEGELFVGADAGEGGTLVFTPRETGSFTFYCTVPQHRSLGMEGEVTIEP